MLIRRSQGRPCAALLTTALCLLVTSQSVVEGISYSGRRMSASAQRKAGNRRADLGRDYPLEPLATWSIVDCIFERSSKHGQKHPAAVCSCFAICLQSASRKPVTSPILWTGPSGSMGVYTRGMSVLIRSEQLQKACFLIAHNVSLLRFTLMHVK